MSMRDAEIDDQPRPSPSRPERTAIDTASEAVDMDVLTSFDEGQPEEGSDLVVELIDLYLREAARLMLAVQQALDKKDQLSIKRAVHSLKGSSSTLGILQMALICDELERTEFNDLFPIASELFSCMEHEFARVRPLLLAERQRRLA